MLYLRYHYKQFQVKIYLERRQPTHDIHYIPIARYRFYNGDYPGEAALKANRRILKKVLGSRKEEIVSRETLEKLGYNFTYHTHHVISMTKNYEYTFCFNYGYRTAEDGKVKVVKSFK